MRLLLISPENEFTTSAKLTLQRYQGLTVVETPYPEASPQLFMNPRPDIVLMISHPNIAHWVATLQHLGWRGPSIVLMRPTEYNLGNKLLSTTQVRCMAFESIELPFFFALLEQMIEYEPQLPVLQAADQQPSIQDQVFANALSAMARSLTQSLDPDTVLDRLLAALLNLIPCDAADVRLVNGDDVVMTRAFGFPNSIMQRQPPLHYSLYGTRNLRQVAEERRAVLVNDTQKYDGWIKMPDCEWIRTHLTAPIFLDDNLVGFLDVSSAKPHAFNDNHVQALEILAPLAAVALNNARLYHTLSLERDQLMSLANIDQKILAMSDSPQIVMRTILGHALRLLGLTKGISILNTYSQQPEYVHTRGIQDADEMRQLIIDNWEHDYRIYEEHGPNWYKAVEKRPTAPSAFAEWIAKEGVEALLSMPLWLHGQLVGRITLLDTNTRQWKEREIQIIRRLASQAAIAIDKALLMQKLRQRLREAESLNRVLQAAGTTLDAKQMLSNVCNEAKHILEVPCVSAGLIQEGDFQQMGEACVSPYDGALGEVLVPTQGLSLLQALRPNKAIAYPDTQRNAPTWLNELVRPITKSALVVPLIVRESPIGFLLAESPTPRSFNEEEAHLTEVIAAAIAPTLENARLFQEVQEARGETEVAYAELRRLDALKSQFIQNVSHEFRTPLAIVKGYVDLIVEGALDVQKSSDLMPALQAIHTHTDNLVRLVESITTLEDAEVGKLQLVSQPIQPICRAALKANWQKALRRNIELLSTIPDDIPALQLDAEGILRALNQVLDNAVKFSSDGSHIWFNVELHERHVQIQIVDEGIGIAKPELDRIFDRFYQINGATTRRHGGMGLGLSLVREVIQRHGGNVWAESQGEGSGTVVTLVLPLDSERERAKALATAVNLLEQRQA